MAKNVWQDRASCIERPAPRNMYRFGIVCLRRKPPSTPKAVSLAAHELAQRDRASEVLRIDEKEERELRTGVRVVLVCLLHFICEVRDGRSTCRTVTVR